MPAPGGVGALIATDRETLKRMAGPLDEGDKRAAAKVLFNVSKNFHELDQQQSRSGGNLDAEQEREQEQEEERETVEKKSEETPY